MRSNPIARILILIGFLLALPAFASPFTQPKGSSEVSFFAAVWEIGSFFNGEGDPIDLGPDLTQTDFLMSVNHGLNDRLTLVLSLPWSRSERDLTEIDDGSFQINDGVSDARLGLIWRLNSPQKPVAYGLMFGMKWPGEYESDLINSPGDGNFDAEILFTVGRQFQRFTLSADVGYRFRADGPEDEILARLEGSVFVGRRFVIGTSLDWIDQQGGIAIDVNTPTPFWPYSLTEEDVFRVTLSGVVSINDRSAIFAAWGQTLAGTSTARGAQWTLGSAFSF